METKTIKTDSTVTGLTENYLNSLTSIENKINANNYVLKVNGNEVPSDLHKVVIDLSNLTHSGRKKMAKRLWNYNKKGTLRSINYLFHVLKKMEIIQDKVSVDVSHKEAEIQSARKIYVKLKTEAEAARLAYKSIKGDFYKHQ
jgi:hypothetical protein